MSSDWYYVVGSDRAGPVPTAELIRLKQEGRIDGCKGGLLQTSRGPPLERKAVGQSGQLPGAVLPKSGRRS